MQCVLPNTTLKKCPSEHDAMCPSEHKLELSWNSNCGSHKGLPIPPTSSKTYPYPKGEHNGAVGPKYASKTNWGNIQAKKKFK